MKVFESSDAGASFIFGDLVSDVSIGAIFAFKVLPVIIFVSALIEICNYLGMIDRVIRFFAWIFHRFLGITGLDAFISSALIMTGIETFTGVKKYFKFAGRSEIFLAMTAFLATISGSVLASYVSFGIPARDLLCASLMSAPAAILFAKIMVPADKEDENTLKLEDIHLQNDSKNIIEAFTSGGLTGLKMALNVGALVIIFVGLTHLANETLSWGCSLIHVKAISLENIFSVIFTPFAYLMGVPVKDIEPVSILLGKKTVLNEFIAYYDLKNYLPGGSMEGQLSPRSIQITTYALCGFSNFGSLGILLGGFSTIAPHFKTYVSRNVHKALLAGTLASFLTATLVNILS